jgi:hypothetical protein
VCLFGGFFSLKHTDYTRKRVYLPLRDGHVARGVQLH